MEKSEQAGEQEAGEINHKMTEGKDKNNWSLSRTA